ncbi:alpha,alpha-trehalose phosphorylase [Ruaniaceae bacterium KH17]|nr:alpha,alpha-trehalose phosphorylase [Ruaniaceae bacterium KH17]
MSPRRVSADPIDRSTFPVDPWRLVESRYNEDNLGATETFFAVGNGYLGMRANPEEGRSAYQHGTFINGFHETWPIRHAEDAFGFAETGQTIVNVPDAKVMKIYVDDEPLLLSIADLEQYERSIDFREGVLRRELIWRTPAGKRVRITSSRMVSFTDRHLALMSLEIEMLEGSAPVVVSSQIINRQDGRDDYHAAKNGSAGSDPEHQPEFDPRKAGKFEGRVLEAQFDWHSTNRMILGYRCTNSGMTLAVGADHSIETENEYTELESTEPDIGKKVYRISAREGSTIRILKAVAYHTSRGIPVRELSDRCRRVLDRVREEGHEIFAERQREWLAEFWTNSDVELDGDPAAQQATRWCIFQLAQCAARADGQGIAAKGVTGDGYEGHYFWDTDIYVVPFLIHTNPKLARNALRFRYNLLPAAQKRARVLTQRGALFPWRTISGEEASAYYAAGTAQYHIDADVAFAFAKYADVTGDTEFMHRNGADVLVETARLWADLGFWRVSGTEQSFHIHGVTGPDEYTAVVNNNLFTNVMARYNLRRASALMLEMKESDPANYARILQDRDLAEDEILEWAACADAMYIPYDENFGIHPQDEHFLEREIWDVANTPPSKRPLLLHYHPLVIYRFQVLKQADIVLALFLQGDQFTPAQKRSDFEYYDPITTGDSTLSAVVQSIVAAEVGYQDLAMTYFMSGLYVDLADLHRNASDGVHIASAGGVWNALVYGFAGMRDHDGKITFDPRLPEEWNGLRFPIRIRDSRIRVHLTAGTIEFTLEEGEPRTVFVRGQEILVDGVVGVPLDGQGPRRSLAAEDASVVGETRADGTLITATVPDVDAPREEAALLGFEHELPAG